MVRELRIQQQLEYSSQLLESVWYLLIKSSENCIVHDHVPFVKICEQKKMPQFKLNDWSNRNN